jgi:NAD(P)H-hydrate epimerase
MPARFVTDTGQEVPAVTAAQMREVDRIAIEEIGPNLFQMMENAGSNLAAQALEALGERWREVLVVVLAGPGGNGGGGICAARHLANHGVRVALCLSEPGRLAPVPALQRQIFRETIGIEVATDRLAGERPDLIVDALIGYSLAGPPRGTAAELIRWANGSAPILSLDVPSGLDATTGEAPGEVARARWTMTLALPKTELLDERAGEIVLADIGIPEGVYRRAAIPYRTPFDRRTRVPLHRSR